MPWCSVVQISSESAQMTHARRVPPLIFQRMNVWPARLLTTGARFRDGTCILLAIKTWHENGSYSCVLAFFQARLICIATSEHSFFHPQCACM